MNTFGNIFRLTDFGESHGPAMGGVVDGVPSGVKIDVELIQQKLDARRPGQSAITSARNEADRIEILSGLTPEGITIGSPIGFIVRNRDHRSVDYDEMKGKFRPNHADFAWWQKFGTKTGPGGGRASARQTLCRVVAGAIASQLLAPYGINITARLCRVGNVGIDNPFDVATTPTPEMVAEILRVKTEGDSVGGEVACRICNVPTGLGEPVYNKLQAMLAYAMMGINGAKGFEYGDGFAAAASYGMESADIFASDNSAGIHTLSNHSGGIQGGMSNGADISLRVAFKPTPTLLRDLPTVDVEGKETVLKSRGRHDPCIAVRAVPVVEAMAAMVICDAMLMDGMMPRHPRHRK